jgi:hypothetical protein
MLGIVVHYESNKIATPQRLKVNYVKDQGNNQIIKAPPYVMEKTVDSQMFKPK